MDPLQQVAEQAGRALLACQTQYEGTLQMLRDGRALMDAARAISEDPAAALAGMGEAEFLRLAQRCAAVAVCVGDYERLKFIAAAARHLRDGGDPDDL